MSISIALTKGRLEKETVKLLDKANFGTEELKNKGRRLVFNDTIEEIKYFLVKAVDSITGYSGRYKTGKSFKKLRLRSRTCTF